MENIRKYKIVYNGITFDNKVYKVGDIVEIDWNDVKSLSRHAELLCSIKEEKTLNGVPFVEEYQELEQKVDSENYPIIYTGGSFKVLVNDVGEFTKGVPQWLPKKTTDKLVNTNKDFKYCEIYASYRGSEEFVELKIQGKKQKFYRFSPVKIPLSELYWIKKIDGIYFKTLEDGNGGEETFNYLKNLIKEKGHIKIEISRICCRGDVFMITPLCRVLKEELKEIDIVFRTDSYSSPILENNPYINKIITNIFEQEKDIDFKINCDGINPLNQEDPYLHYIDNVFQKVELLPMDRNPNYYITESEKQKAKDYLTNRICIDWNKKTIGICISSNAPQRSWSDEKVVELKEILLKKYNVIYLDERSVHGEYEWCGKKYNRSLRENFALAYYCDVILSPDTCWIQLANALKKKYVALFSYVQPTARIGFDADCLYLRGAKKDGRVQEGFNNFQENYDIQGIPVEDVYNAIERKLEIGNKKVSIIIITYNNYFYAKQLVEALKNTVKNIDYEIIVVDNNSKIPIPKCEEDYRLITMPKNFGVPGARNEGARNSIGEYLLFLDDDMLPIKQGWLERAIECYEERNTGILGAKLIFPDGRIQHAGINAKDEKGYDATHIHLGYLEPRNSPKFCINREIDCNTGAFTFVKRSRFFEAGCFDDQYGLIYCQDPDMCLKLMKLGYVNYYCADIEFIHFLSIVSIKVMKEYNYTSMNAFIIHAKKLLRNRWGLK